VTKKCGVRRLGMMKVRVWDKVVMEVAGEV